jgi:protein-S-isoprenylcysteine O-methyltransferase Ste14
MNMDAAHRSRWEISEIIFGIPFLASIALQWLLPLSLPQGSLKQALIPMGTALLIVGLSFIVSARREFAQYSQSMEPGHPISKIVQTGVFSISRNPLYLGIALALSGIALVLNILWILVLLIPAMMLCHFVLIAPEERYLTNKFGEDYLAYAASVRRWLGRK